MAQAGDKANVRCGPAALGIADGADRAAMAPLPVRPHGGRATSSARGSHHLALLSCDVEATITFYQDLLEFPLTELFENGDYQGSTHFFFDIGHGNLLAFFDFPGLGLAPAVEAVGGVQHVAISVPPEELQRVKARLDEQGIPYLGPDRGLETSIYFRDPDGI